MDELLSSIGSGECRFEKAHRVALACERDGSASEQVKAFALCGGHGLHTQSIERDCHRWLRCLHDLQLEPYFLRMRLYNPRLCDVVETSVAILPPHEIVYALYNKGPQLFQRVMLGDNSPSVLAEWWDNAMMEPWGAKHPAAVDPSLLDSMYPLMFHYDGAEAYTNEEAHIWSCGSCFGSGSVFDSKWLICAIMNVQVPTADLLQGAHESICKFLAWSLDFGMRGVAPKLGYHDEPFLRGSLRAFLADKPLGVRSCFGGLKADRKAAVYMHSFRRSWMSNFACEMCLAVWPRSKTPRFFSWGYFTPHAAWRNTLVSHEAYMSTEGQSPWRFVPGWHMLLNYEDLLHNALLGHAGDAVVSTIKDLLIHQLLPGNTWEQAVATLGIEFRIWCKAHRIKHAGGIFTLGALGLAKLSEYPKIHSRVKAAHVRILVSFIAEKANDVDRADEHGRLRTCLIWALADFFYTLDHAKRWLDDDQARCAFSSAYLYLHCYQKLASDSLADRIFNYKVRPNHHYFCHLVERMFSSSLNPRHVNTFGD